MAAIRTIIKYQKGEPVLLKTGEVNIYLKYTHQSKHVLFSTGVRIQPDQWNGEQNQLQPVKGTGRTTKNQLVSQAKQTLEQTIFNLRHEGKEPTVDAVKTAMKKAKAVPASDVISLFDKYISYSKTVKTEGTVKLTLRSKADYIEYCNYKKISPKLSEIDLRFYDGYVNYLFEKRGMATNTVGKCIKDLKAFLNWARSRGYKVQDEVRKFKVLREDTAIIYLTQSELETLWQHEFNNERIDKVRDLFCMQCFTGLRWSDLTRLGKQHIQGDVVRMVAFKTKKRIIVPLSSRAREVLNKYQYKLPKMTEQEANRVIKQACKKAGIVAEIEVAKYQGGKKLFRKVEKWEVVKTHTAVKSFITHAVERGISPKVVANITGKTVDVIVKHYYGTSEDQIISEMTKAFG